VVYVEGDRDLGTRLKVWEFQEVHNDFWEQGRVELRGPAHEDYKVNSLQIIALHYSGASGNIDV
jgi:hypothetical protein